MICGLITIMAPSNCFVKVSEVYLWKRVLTTEALRTYGTCNDHASLSNPFLSWENWSDHWTLTYDNGPNQALSVYKEARRTLCLRELHRTYIGFHEKRDFEGAIQLCRSFGGRLPFPNR